MLPPLQEIVLQENPSFRTLYTSLTTSILHPDGSTKNDPTAKQRDDIREKLKRHRLKATKQHLLKNTLRTAVPPSSSVSAPVKQQQQQTGRRLRPPPQPTAAAPPPALITLLLLLPAFLERAESRAQASPELELLLSSAPFRDLGQQLPHLCRLLSSQLTAQAGRLTRLMLPSTNASFVHRYISIIPTATATLLSTLADRRLSLSQSRLAATASLSGHLGRYTEAVVQILRTLEAKHGPQARCTALRAEEASLEAQECALGLQLEVWKMRSLVYSPEAGEALANYRSHLRNARVGLLDRIRIREAQLSDYGVDVRRDRGAEDEPAGVDGKERTLREMARVLREMESRLEEVNTDLARLGKR